MSEQPYYRQTAEQALAAQNAMEADVEKALRVFNGL